MKQTKIVTDKRVAPKFKSYPDEVRPKLIFLRDLILETAEEMDSLDFLEETLKWEEPSYVAKKGSTIRLDWKRKTPNQYAMYFKCTTKLVDTFKSVFGETFTYQTTRAIVFELEDLVPTKELKQCIKAALQYHVVKKKPLLGL